MQKGTERIQLLQETCQMHHLWGAEQEQSQQQLVWTLWTLHSVLLPKPSCLLSSRKLCSLVPA